MSSTDALINIQTRHQLYTQRYAGGTFKELNKHLTALKKDLKRILTNKSFNAMTPTQQRLIIKTVSDQTLMALARFDDSLLFKLSEFAEYEIGFVAEALDKSTNALAIVSAPVLKNSQINSAILSNVLEVEPGRQMTMAKALEGFKTAQIKRLKRTLRDGFIEGSTVEQMGDKIADNLKITKLQAETITRTATNATSDLSRRIVYDENSDILEGWQFVATLDSHTSLECASLDGRVFKLSDTRYKPPRHWGCRSTSIPVVKDEYSIATGKEERSAAGGAVSAKTTYGGWLRAQSKATQIEVLGVARAKEFRAGNLTLDKFVDRKGRTYTLNQLKKKDLIE